MDDLLGSASITITITIERGQSERSHRGKTRIFSKKQLGHTYIDPSGLASIIDHHHHHRKGGEGGGKVVPEKPTSSLLSIFIE